MSLTLHPVGILHSPYKEKFAVPRQANLVKDGIGYLELLPPFNLPETVRGLETFSHLWLIFHFHHIPTGKWQPTVRPPRLGGNQRVGVFASRATHRPNPLGLSKVELLAILKQKGKIYLELGGIDLVDGTPIFDIKPYLAYADSEPLACSGFAQEKPQAYLNVIFPPEIAKQIQEIEKVHPHFGRFLTDVLAQDPRPAYHQHSSNNRIYGSKLHHFNIRWQVSSRSETKMSENVVKVIQIIPLK